jgi:hypothetical protein
LEFVFISNCATGKANADAAERSACFDASGTIRVGVSMGNMSIKLGFIVKEDVLFVAVDGR